MLPDGDQVRDYGLMAGLVRLPGKGKDVLIFSNIESPSGRHHGTVWASFDGGKTWPVKRLVFDGGFAYSSLTAGRPSTPSEGWIYLLFEGGPKGGHDGPGARRERHRHGKLVFLGELRHDGRSGRQEQPCEADQHHQDAE